MTANDTIPAPTITRFERLMLAVARLVLLELAARDQSIRGLPAHIERLASKFHLDEDIQQRAEQWLATSRREHRRRFAHGAPPPPQPWENLLELFSSASRRLLDGRAVSPSDDGLLELREVLELYEAK